MLKLIEYIINIYKNTFPPLSLALASNEYECEYEFVSAQGPSDWLDWLSDWLDWTGLTDRMTDCRPSAY